MAGISYGSEVALEFAVTYPEMTDRLILLNATAATGWWLGDIGRAWNLASGSGEAYYHTAIPVIYSPDFYTKRHAWMENRKKLLIPLFENPDFIGAMRRLTDSSESYDLRDRLDHASMYEQPTLFTSLIAGFAGLPQVKFDI